MLDWAQYYARLGIAVHPLYPNQKRPVFTDWSKRTALTEAELPSAFGGQENVGIRPGVWSQPVTGYSLVVIDLDIRKEEEAEVAQATLQRFLNVDLSAYPTTVSGSGGSSRHLWMLVANDRLPKSQRIACSGVKYLDPVTGANRFTWEIDLESTGSNLAVPPSIHPDTLQRYTWEGKMPHDGIPLMPDHALAKLKAETEQDRADADQPDLLPTEDLPEVEELLLSVAQRRMLVDGESYGLHGDRSRDIMGLSSILFHQGYDRQQVLSILAHHAPGQIATEGTHAAKDPVKWLWRYGVTKTLGNEKPEAFERYQRRNGLAPAPVYDPTLDEWGLPLEDVAPDPTPTKNDAWEDLQEQARRCAPDDPDRAVMIYYAAKKNHGPVHATMIADLLKDHGQFSHIALREAAKLKGKELARRIKGDTEGVAPVVSPYDHGEAWRDPLHPVHTGNFKSEWDKIVSRYIYIPASNKWFDLDKRMQIGPEGLNMKLAHSIRALLVEDGFDPDELPRNPKAAEYLVNRENVVMVDGETFFPGAKGHIVEWEGGAYINRWQAPDVKAIPTGDSEIKPWLDHVTYVFPQPEYRRALFDWLAWVVQNQDQKVNWQLVVGGLPGIGKDSIWNLPIRIAVGDRFFSDVPFAEVESQYDDWRVDKKFILVQESHQSNKRDWAELENRLKTICAAPPETVTLNPKFGLKVTQPNLTALIFTTNYRDGFLPEDHRRYHFLWSDATVPSGEYFEGLHRWLEGGGALKVAQWLLTRQVSSDFNPKRPPPSTEWGESIKFQGIAPANRKIREAIDHFMREGRTFIAPEQIKEYLKAEDQLTGDGFVPGVEKITSVMQGFGMRPLTDQNNRPEIDVPKCILGGGFLAVDLENTKRTCVFPLKQGYLAGSKGEVWLGMCSRERVSEINNALWGGFPL